MNKNQYYRISGPGSEEIEDHEQTHAERAEAWYKLNRPEWEKSVSLTYATYDDCIENCKNVWIDAYHQFSMAENTPEGHKAIGLSPHGSIENTGPPGDGYEDYGFTAPANPSIDDYIREYEAKRAEKSEP